MRTRHWIAAFALVSAGIPAAVLARDDCEFHAERTAGADTSGVEKVVIRAGAGELKVTGRSNAARADAHGKACASTQALLDKSTVTVRRDGKTLYVESHLPQDDEGISWSWNDNARIDLEISLPSGLPVDATDSSGDASFADLKSLAVQDSSGGLRIERIAGLADVGDSSGEIEIDHAGSVRVRDSSGGIDIAGVRADVDVQVDSSGDIEIRDVGGGVHIGEDSSGEIRVEQVKGSVTVDSDSSGGIYASRVSGDFTVREDGSGVIDHDAIGGKIVVPAKHAND